MSNQLTNKLFELTVDTLVRLKSDTNNATDILANILKEGMLQRGNYEVEVIPTPDAQDTLVRIVHPKNVQRATIDMSGHIRVIEYSGVVKGYDMSELDKALDHIYQEIVQRF